MKKLRDLIPRRPLSASPATSSRRRLPHWLRRSGLALQAMLTLGQASFATTPSTPEISIEPPVGTALGKRVVAWGYNHFGQTMVPVAAQSGVSAVAAGGGHTVALKSDGSVVAWGWNDFGQTTVPVAAQSGVNAIAAGLYHTLALKSDGSVVAWGYNGFGQTTVPVAAQSGVSAIAAGESHTVALKSDGSAVAWGYNDYGQTTVPMAAQSGVGAIAAGYYHNVALVDSAVDFGMQIPGTTSAAKTFTIKNTGDGALSISSVTLVGADATAFSVNTTGALTSVPATTGTTTFTVTFHPGSAGAKSTTLRIANNDSDEASYDIALAGTGTAPQITIEEPIGTVLPNGLAAWGANFSGQTTIPAEATGLTAIESGDNFSVGLKSDGTVIAWGSNTVGETVVPAGLTGVTAVSAGYLHVLALKSDGTVVGWGHSSSGQASPPAGLTGVVAVSAQENHSVALKNDGTVVCWGANSLGQGNVPAGLTGVVAISAGHFHTLALKSDGTVVAWGGNARSEAEVPAGLAGLVAISVASTHSLALKSDGTVVAWGSNNNGQCDVPAGLTGVVSVTAAGSHSHALKSDGTVVSWGNNDYGQNDAPLGLPRVKAISAGYFHMLALTSPTVSFGDQSTASTSAVKTFAIRNIGNADLSITSATISGTDAADFTLDTGSVISPVPTAGSTTFTVAFHPTSTGAKTATLRVLSDDADEGTFDILLTGTGTYAPVINAFTSAGRTIDINVLGAQLRRALSVPTITILTQPTHGTASVVNGKVRFAPQRTFPAGGDSFTYQIDNDGEIVTGTIQVMNFTTVAGDYDGLVEDPGEVTAAEAHQHGGHLRLSITKTGVFSGVISFAGERFSSSKRRIFRGVGRTKGLGSDGTVTFEIKRLPAAPITIALEYDTENGMLTGTASSTDAGENEFTSTFTLARKAADDEAAGSYTLRIAPDDTAGTPQGTGFAAVQIKGDGMVRYSGKLADGTPYSGGAYRHEDGSFPLYTALYGRKLAERGSLRGNVGSETPLLLRIRGSNLNWFKPARARDDYFPEGIAVNRDADLYRYQEPARGTRVLDFAPGTGNGLFRITHGDVAVNEAITLGTDNRASVVGLSASGLSLHFNMRAGFFMGHFKHPTTEKRTPFSGAVFQQARFGGGYFMGDGPIDGCSVQIEDSDR